MYTRAVLLAWLLASTAFSAAAFYSTGLDQQTDAGVMEDYYFTLSNNASQESVWFNITIPFQVDYSQTDPPQQVEGSTLCYNVSLGSSQSVTVKIRARASTPGVDQNVTLTAAYDYGQGQFNQTVRAPQAVVANHSAPARVLAGQEFKINFTLENHADQNHTGVLYSVSGLTQPTTDFSVVQYPSILSVPSGSSANASILLRAPLYSLNQTLSNTVYSLVDPFTYKAVFNTSVRSVYPSVSVSVYNDSSHSSPASEFLPNQTVYVNVRLTDPADGSLIQGNLSVALFDNDSSQVFSFQNFTSEQDFSYALNSTALSGGWTVNVTELTSGSTGRAVFNVKPVISGLEVTTCRASPCTSNTVHFAPSDTLYAVITPVDQAGRPVQGEYNTSVNVTAAWNASLSSYDQGTGELSVALPAEYGFLTVNASAWNNQSNLSQLSQVDIPVLPSISFSPTQPYNYGQQANVSITFSDVDGNTVSPDSLAFTVYDDTGAYYSSPQASFSFNVSGSVNATETQRAELNLTKGHYNSSLSENISVTNQLTVQENILPEYERGQTMNASFSVFHADSEPHAANVSVTLHSPSNTTQLLYSGQAHSAQVLRYFNYSAEQGEWTVSYVVSDAHGNNASVSRSFNLSSVILEVSAHAPADGMVIAGLPFNVSVSVRRNQTLVNASVECCVDSSCFNMTQSQAGVFTQELNLSHGTHFLSFNASDEYNNTGTASLTLTAYNPPNVSATLIAPSSVYSGHAFSVILRVNNTGEATANVTASLAPSSFQVQNALVPSGSSHDFSWQASIYSDTAFTGTAEWQTGSAMASKTVAVTSSSGGGSSYFYYPILKRSNQSRAAGEAGNQTVPEDTVNMDVRLPEEGRQYYNPVMISVFSNAGSCVLLPYNEPIPRSGQLFFKYKNFSIGVNTVRIMCVKGNASVQQNVTFVVKRRSKAGPSVKTSAGHYTNPPQEEKGVKASGAAVLNPSLAAGAAFAAGLFAFAAGLRLVRRKVKKRYPLQGYTGWRKWV